MSDVGIFHWEACERCVHYSDSGKCRPVKDSGSRILTIDIVDGVITCDEFEEVEDE